MKKTKKVNAAPSRKLQSTPKRRKSAQQGKNAVYQQGKTTQRKHKPARRKASWLVLLRKYIYNWPTWIGALIVIVTCWLLLRWVLTSQTTTPAPQPPMGFSVHGIDISHHQGDIDWELVRNRAFINEQPLQFVFIKATEGSDIVDSRFKRNFQAARQHGIVRGAYHFYRTSTPAKRQAEHFINHVKLEEGDLPPVLDVEVKPANVSLEDFRQGILEWLLRIEQHYKVKPIIYTYHSFHQQYMNDSIFNLYPYWIAHYYVDSVRYRGPWAFWQYSDAGQLSGIKEKVDLDVFHGTYDELLQLTIK